VILYSNKNEFWCHEIIAYNKREEKKGWSRR